MSQGSTSHNPPTPTRSVDASHVAEVLRKLRKGTVLEAAELSLVGDIVESWAHLCERAQRFDLSLAELRRMLGVLGRPSAGGRDRGAGGVGGGGSEPSPSSGDSSSAGDVEVTNEGDATCTSNEEGSGDTLNTGSDSESDEESSPNRDNHGRRGEADFGHLPCLRHAHQDLAPGCACPACEQGRLYRFFARTFVTIAGQAPFVGNRHEMERLQCNVCAEIFEAALPEMLRADGVGTGNLYTHSAHTTVVLLKYLGVMPWYRQQTLQSAMGVMVPDACMWDMSETLATLSRPVVSILKLLAAASPLLYGDDTTAAIFGLKNEVKPNRKTGKDVDRSGCHTTVVIARLNDGRHVAIFRVGIQHTGELMDELLSERPSGLPPPLVMGDASSSNGVTVCSVHRCGCNAHALRNFKALEDKYPAELTGILAAYRKIYDHDAYTLAQEMDDATRLAYHRQHSRPLFQQMCRDAQALLDELKVEPNSNLGGALDYLLNHQRALSAFFRLPGAPIDNNMSERELRLPVRLRDGAPLFRSQIGASVAGDLWTLLVTTLLNDVNAFDYLNAMQRHPDDVRAAPREWLPWNYQSRTLALDRARRSADQPTPSAPTSPSRRI